MENQLDLFLKYLEENKLFEETTDDLDETCCPYKWAKYYHYIRRDDLVNAIKSFKEKNYEDNK